MEIKVFNNIYTQTQITNEFGNKIDLGQRQSFLNNQFRYVYGISENRRLNAGLEANYSFSKYSDSASGNFDILSSGGASYKHSQLANIGPTIRFTPIESIGNFSVTSTFLFPIKEKNLESPKFTNHNRYTWWNQIFYDYSITSKWNLFMEVDLLVRFKNSDQQNSFFRLPVSTFISYFPSNKLTLYSNLQYAPAFGRLEGFEDSAFGLMRWYTQLGLGGKYLVTSFLELEASYGKFVASKRDGAGEVFNFGIRIIR